MEEEEEVEERGGRDYFRRKEQSASSEPVSCTSFAVDVWEGGRVGGEIDTKRLLMGRI